MTDRRYQPSPSAHRATGHTSFATYIGLTPRHALALRRQAERHESTGAFELAVKNWTLALTIDPSHAGAWRGLARTLRALERNEEASLVERNHIALERSLS